MNKADLEKVWKQLKMFEHRGDLLKQAELLKQALRPIVEAEKIDLTLQLCKANADLLMQKEAPEVWSVNQETQKIEIKNAYTGAVKKEILIPKEQEKTEFDDLNWTEYGNMDLQVFEVKNQILLKQKGYRKLSGLEAGLVSNPAYSYCNIRDYQDKNYNIFLNSLYFGSIPIENAKSHPFDIYNSPKHPVIAIVNRGANKLHLYDRTSFRLVKTWKINAPNKKAFALSFHPDGKRIFIAAFEKNCIYCIDRQMVMKRIPININKEVRSLALNTKGDRLYTLSVSEKSPKPSIDIFETQKYKHIGVIELEGEAFSSGADAKDLFQITPDGQWAIVMVSKNQPALFTPCLLLVNLKTKEIVSKENLTTNEKPIHIGFLARHLTPPQIKLLPNLIHTQGVDQEQVKTLFQVEHL